MQKRNIRTTKLNSTDLLDAAEALLSSSSKQVFLRRAVSTTYYALFHAIANCCADTLIGAGAHHKPTRPAWRDTYRALDHSRARSKCVQVKRLPFPNAIIDFADLFVTMHGKRNEADYDPYARFYKSECINDLLSAREVIEALGAQSLVHRRAFAAFLLFNRDR